jgi:spore coat polysaccharide biosynthesis protein SpsF
VKVLVIVQARMASTRLPGKVLLPVAGAPLLQRMLERVRAARAPFDLVVATTDQADDDRVAALAERNGVDVFRGHRTDLLDRHYRAARSRGADVVVKIPSDCPLIEPAAIDRVLEAFLADPDRYDYIGNLHPATWPDGNDVEVLPFAILDRAWREASRPHEREHTTPFIWDRPGRFRLGNVTWETGLDYSMSHRFTIDYAEDYAFVTALYDALWRPDRPAFGLREILALLDDRPELMRLNSAYAGVNWYRHHLSELRTVGRHETRLEGAP